MDLQEKKRNANFKSLIGKTIKKIDSSAINIVKIEFTDGTSTEIDAESLHFGIGVVTCSEAK